MSGKNNLNIPFQDLNKLHDRYKEEIEDAIKRVTNSGWFILGKEVEKFEAEFSKYNNIKHTITVGSGTDAIRLALESLDISDGDEVITVSHTFISTALAISALGATPTFVDINQCDHNINHNKIEKAITSKTKAILVVHINGYIADMDEITGIAQKHKIHIVEDACQAHGAEYNGKKAGTLGDLGCFSFYPTKNLGAYGDGGAIITNNNKLAKKVRLLRNYGEISKYHYKTKGTNSRLDEIQAAILRVKLKHLDEMNERRREIARVYTKAMKNLPISLPTINKNTGPKRHNHYLYPIVTNKRETLQKFLERKGVGTQIHYPIPIHLQKSYKELSRLKSKLPVTERICKEILSLPMHSELTKKEVNYVSNLIKIYFQ